jgi:hypothetical protein
LMVLVVLKLLVISKGMGRVELISNCPNNLKVLLGGSAKT